MLGVKRSFTTASAAARHSSPGLTGGKAGQKVCLIEGARTPFLTSGTGFKKLMAHDIGRFALQGLARKTALDWNLVDNHIMGTVIQEAKTSNIAKESGLGAGMPNTIPCHTVTMACISSNQAITAGVEQILAGQAETVVASGVETFSDVPIRFSRPLRERMLAAGKIKSPAGYLGLLKGIKLKDFAPEAPGIAEFSTGEIMGHSADRLAAAFGVTREEQDAFALRSHKNAAAAQEKGQLIDVVPVTPPPSFTLIDRDNGVRGDSTPEGMAKLKPAFIKPHGTVTAASSSFLTDGGSAALLMSEDAAKRNGMTPKGYIKDYIYVAQDPKEELLLGPAYATCALLARNGLTLKDIDVFEYHEAFAAQILSNLAALDSVEFCQKALTHVGRGRPLGELPGGKVGAMPMERFNLWGGSLSLGHPFGATGVRLATTAANRMIAEDGQLALIAACAAGGQGHAMLIQRA